MITRRTLIGSGLGLAGAAMLPVRLLAAEIDTSDLAPMTGAAVPIGKAERAQRLARAQALMQANGIGAVLLEPGSSMVYFGGIEWWRSEDRKSVV